jgi:hypothetical protein
MIPVLVSRHSPKGNAGERSSYSGVIMAVTTKIALQQFRKCGGGATVALLLMYVIAMLRQVQTGSATIGIGNGMSTEQRRPRPGVLQ